MEPSPLTKIAFNAGFIISLVASTGLLIFWAATFFKLSTQLKSAGLSIRGVLKLFAYGKIPAELQDLTRNFFFLTLGIWLMPCLWVIVLSWGSDYSFLIALFPLFYYFLLARFFVWQKTDIENKHSKKNRIEPFEKQS